MALPPPSSGGSRTGSSRTSPGPGYNPQVGDVDPLTGLPYMAPPSKFMGGSNAEGHTPGRGLSVGEIMSQREGRSNAYYGATGKPVPRGTRLMASGWNTSGVGPGTRGYRGSGVIGSAAGALGSPGIPTSQRGRAEKYNTYNSKGDLVGGDFAEVPAWAMSQMMRDNAGGLAQDWSRANMGMIPRSPVVAPGMGRTGSSVNPLMQESASMVGQAINQESPIRSTSSNSGNWFENLIRQFQPIF